MGRLLCLLLVATVGLGHTATSATAVKPKTKQQRCLAKAKKVKGKKARQKAVARCKAKPKPKPAPAPSLDPVDYLATKNLSEPRFDAKEIERVVTKLPSNKDGVELHIEVVKPKGATNLGVIVEASGYHGTLYDRTGTRIFPLPLDKAKKPIGLTGFFPQRGYAVVMMDLRGTGKSGGCLDHLGPNDAADIKTTIEWATSQPWSNGRAGILGHSYVGGTSVVAAAQQPKGLVTAVVSAGLSSMYEHQFQGGVPYNAQFLGPYIGYSGLALDSDLPPGAEDPVTGAPTGDGFGEHPENTGCGFTNLAANAGPSQYWGGEEAYHKERRYTEAATAFKGDVFFVHGINDEAARITSMKWFTERGGRPGDKAWVGQWDHGIGCCPNQRAQQWQFALHAWFDKQLLGRDVVTGPPVEIFLNDAPTEAAANSKRGQIATFRTWPPAPSSTFTFVAEGDKSYAADPRGYQGQPTGQVEYVSKPIEKDTTVIGVPKLELVASHLQQCTNLIANVISESPTGERRRIGHFAINAILREGTDRFTPVVPAEPMKLDPAAWAMGHVLRKGHKLVLQVRSSDPEHLPFCANDPQVTVYGTGENVTTLRLPVVDTKLHDDRFPLGQKPNGAGVTG